MFNFHIPTKILFGFGQISTLHEQDLPGRKALIVISSGKSTRKNGYLDTVLAELKKADIDSVIFDDIQPNPSKDNVMDGAAFAKANGCDFVIGLGGGSSMDAAKAIAVMATNDGDYWDYMVYGTGKGMPLKNKPLPMVAISTTAGTGTEADAWTVITNEDKSEKVVFGNADTFPVLSIVDPEMMCSVPPLYTAYQGFDALFHNVEGYISKKANLMTDMFAITAIEAIGQNLAKAVSDGKDLFARTKVAFGNTLGGFVMSTGGMTSQHALEHALSANHPQLPHGAGLIMISEAYFTFHAKSGKCNKRMIEMARAMGKEDPQNPMDFISALVDLQKACGVYGLKMSDYGIKKADFPAYEKNARETKGNSFAMDPAPISPADCINIFEDSYR